MYIQKRRVQHPDTDDQLFSIKKSLEYILTFCTKNKISVSEYTDHATGDIPTYIKHIKHGNVNVYTMFGFANFESTLKSVPVDILKFTLGDIYQNIPRLRTNFQSSKLAKVFISAGINKITTAIKI